MKGFPIGFVLLAAVVLEACGEDCRPEQEMRCSGHDLVWLDSCGNLGEVAQHCDCTCSLDEPVCLDDPWTKVLAPPCTDMSHCVTFEAEECDEGDMPWLYQTDHCNEELWCYARVIYHHPRDAVKAVSASGTAWNNRSPVAQVPCDGSYDLQAICVKADDPEACRTPFIEWTYVCRDDG